MRIIVSGYVVLLQLSGVQFEILQLRDCTLTIVEILASPEAVSVCEVLSWS